MAKFFVTCFTLETLYDQLQMGAITKSTFEERETLWGWNHFRYNVGLSRKDASDPLLSAITGDDVTTKVNVIIRYRRTNIIIFLSLETLAPPDRARRPCASRDDL